MHGQVYLLKNLGYKPHRLYRLVRFFKISSFLSRLFFYNRRDFRKAMLVSYKNIIFIICKNTWPSRVSKQIISLVSCKLVLNKKLIVKSRRWLCKNLFPSFHVDEDKAPNTKLTYLFLTTFVLWIISFVSYKCIAFLVGSIAQP